MALKDKLGLAMIPSAYSGVADENNAGGTLGTVHSVFPKGGNGDFDFSRGSDATRVNSQGYIESVQVLSDELVQNGDFEQIGDELITNGDFSNGENSWNFTSNNKLSVSNNKLYYNADGGFSTLTQTSILNTSKTYKITFDFDASSVTSGSFKMAGDAFSNYSVAERTIVDGFNVFYFQPSFADFRIGEGGAVGVGIFDNISVKEVGQNWEFSGNASFNNGILRLVDDNTNTLSGVKQQGILTSGKFYKIAFEVTRHSSGNAQVVLGSNTNTENVTLAGIGTYTVYGESGGTYFQIKRDGSYPDFDFDIDNISVKEVTRDTDIPRLDYSDGACPTLLLEPQRSNLITYSEDFSQWTSEQLNFTLNSVVSPEGIQNAVTFADNTSNSRHRISQFASFTSGENYTLSIFVKKNSNGKYLLMNANAAFGARAALNLDTLEIVNLNGTNGKIESYGNDWYRFSISGQASSTVNTTFFIQIQETATDVSYVGDGGSFYLYGAQLEEGSYATSYIPTHGSAVTRLADVCNNAGDSTIFNDEEGVLYAEIAAIVDDLTFRVIGLSDDTNDNIIKFGYRTDSNEIYYEVRDGGVSQSFQKYNVSDITQFHKVAVKFKENDFAMWIDGSEVLTKNSGSVPSGLNVINFNSGGTSSEFSGKVKSLLYFDRALTDEELEDLTSSRINNVLSDYSTLLNRAGATYESTGLETELNKLF